MDTMPHLKMGSPITAYLEPMERFWQSLIRKLRWNNLLEKICLDISVGLDITLKRKFDEVTAPQTFLKLISRMNEKFPDKKIILIFDEVEYISFKARQDKHWLNDYIDFWQSIWSCQSINKNFSFILCGVNPFPLEIDTVNNLQNPLFGIVSYDYLKGFSIDELDDMVKTLGIKMGLNFSIESIVYLFSRYGGHPLLTRKACSWLNKQWQIKGEKRPINIDLEKVEVYQEAMDSELSFYCGHVVSEIKEFYPEEFEMLELLSSGQTNDFLDLTSTDTFIKHLKNYGLLSFDSDKLPIISIPVVKIYIGEEMAKREKRSLIHKIIEKSNRDGWLKKRIPDIIKNFRLLERLIHSSQLTLLFGFNSFPEAEKLSEINESIDDETYNNFINILNKCFVESIVNYGSSLGRRDYFKTTISFEYPMLYKVLKKIKIYRHNSFHLKLIPTVDKEFCELLNLDLEGRTPTQVQDVWFVLQQKLLDDLLISLQVEINRLT